MAKVAALLTHPLRFLILLPRYTLHSKGGSISVGLVLYTAINISTKNFQLTQIVKTNKRETFPLFNSSSSTGQPYNQDSTPEANMATKRRRHGPYPKASVSIVPSSHLLHVLIQQQVPQAKQIGHEVLLPVADEVLPSGRPRVAGPVAVELLLAADELIGTGGAPHRQRRRARGRNFHRGRFGGSVRRVVRGAAHRWGCGDRQLLLVRAEGRNGGRRPEAAKGLHEVFIHFRFFFDVHAEERGKKTRGKRGF